MAQLEYELQTRERFIPDKEKPINVDYAENFRVTRLRTHPFSINSDAKVTTLRVEN